MNAMRRLIPLVAMTLALFGPAMGAAAPSRVVSINLCADQLLVLLADRSAIASVSFLAADPELSYVADRVAGLPLNHGLAEEVLALAPDLVLAGTYGAGPTVALLRARGVPILQLDLTEDFAAIAAQTRLVAAALGHPERGEALLARMADLLAAGAPPDRAPRPTAMLYQADGFTAGAGTLADAVLTAAGFVNVAAAAGLDGYGYLPLERLVAAAPDVLIADPPPDRAPSLSEALLGHPALTRLGTATRRVEVPDGTLGCGGPYTAEAVAVLGQLRREVAGAMP